MEDWDIAFNNETIITLVPYLEKIGFKQCYDKNEFSIFGREYDYVQIYKKELEIHSNVLCPKIFAQKYNLYFIFYDKHVYPFATNSLYIKRIFSEAGIEIHNRPYNEFFETPEDIKSVLTYINLYLTDYAGSIKYNQNLLNNKKKSFKLYSRDKETGANIDSEI